MNIFYYSVHHILEDDEVRLLQGLSHHVFCLGINSLKGAAEKYRPSIAFGEREWHLYAIYEAMGGQYLNSPRPDHVIPPGLQNHFSAIIIMHSAGFIMQHWDKIGHRPIFWRTIGQGILKYNQILEEHQKVGMRTITYSPTEPRPAGKPENSRLIRFYKNANQYAMWTARIPKVLTFANNLEYRYPIEASDYRQFSLELPTAIGGAENHGLPNNIGFLEFSHQVQAYKDYAVYLCMTGMHIPYTLNFIEAWMTGIPLVVSLHMTEEASSLKSTSSLRIV